MEMTKMDELTELAVHENAKARANRWDRFKSRLASDHGCPIGVLYVTEYGTVDLTLMTEAYAACNRNAIKDALIKALARIISK